MQIGFIQWKHVVALLIAAATCAILTNDQGGMAVRRAESGSWGDEPNHMSLVLAEVAHVGERDPESFWRPITIRPLATLSGGFDSGRQGELELLFHFVAPGDPDLPIKAIPAVNDLVMAVIIKREEGYVVEANFSSFMPWNSPLVVVDGLGDPRIIEVVQRIQEARQEARQKAATRPAAESDLTLIRHGTASFGERLRIAATSADAKVLNLLADFDEPFEVQLLVVMNFNTRAGIVKAYTNLPQDVIDRFEHSEHEILRAAAEWNLANRPAPTTKPATRPPEGDD